MKSFQSPDSAPIISEPLRRPPSLFESPAVAEVDTLDPNLYSTGGGKPDLPVRPDGEQTPVS